MPTMQEIKPLAMALPQRDRALLAEALLGSLPDDFDEEGIEEGHRRLDEALSDPSVIMSSEEFLSAMKRR